jgi:pilus assembly protein CpaB
MTTILLVACVIAGLCALGVYKVMGTRLAANKPVTTTKILGAATDLKLGTVIAANNLTTIDIAGSAPKGAIIDPKDAIGRGVISEVYEGEPLLDSRLAPKGSGGGLAATIPEGMRACAVKVDEVVGVAGFATPGMRVDVLASGNPPGAPQSEGPVTKTILQNIEVLSAGTDIQKDAEGKPQQVQVVNLLVTPEQAEQLSLASNQLKIQLVLRNPTDTKIGTLPTTAESMLFAGSVQAPVHVARSGRRKVEPSDQIVVQNGTKTTTEKFPGAGGQL